jgi:hypothetical protein
MWTGEVMLLPMEKPLLATSRRSFIAGWKLCVGVAWPINLIGLVSPQAVSTLSPIRSSSMLMSPSVVSIRVPGRKQLALHVEHGRGVYADELRPAKHNPNIS